MRSYDKVPYGIQMKIIIKVSKGAKTRNRCNQVPHLTQDTNRKVTNSQLYTTNESQQVSPFPAGDHKAKMNRPAQRYNKSQERTNIKDPQKSTPLEWSVKYFTGFRAPTSPLIQMWIKTHRYLVCMKVPKINASSPKHINQDIKKEIMQR